MGSSPDLTERGTIVGTVTYMSPEICMGEEPDERSDIWSFGVLLFEMLAGRRPWPNPGSDTSPMIAILQEPLPDINQLRTGLPDELGDLLYRMLTKNRSERIPSVRIVGVTLEALQRGLKVPEISTSSPGLFAAGPAGAGSPAVGRPFDALTTTTSDAFLNHNLPRQMTTFIGRERELAELNDLFRNPNAPLITIIGPGGMGKTSLVIEAARRLSRKQSPATGSRPQTAFPSDTGSKQTLPGLMEFPDGIFFVSLAPLSDPVNIPTAVADALGYRFHEEGEPAEQISSYLSRKALLLIFDNFEHLMGGTELVHGFLQAAPRVKFCITSRQRLNLSGETLFQIGGLDFPEETQSAEATSAVQLFRQSARRVTVDYELAEEDLPHVAAICRLVQGMPLGIVLAAAWVDTLTPAEIATEIRADIDFLETELQDVPDRQRSMRATFNYSWQLLNPDEQALFARLSVFRGGFTRQAAKTVAETPLRLLARLASKSLLQYDPGQDRYQVHELLRQFGAEILAETYSETGVQSAHSHYYLKAVANRESDLKGRDQKGAVTAITGDYENVRAAWRWAVTHHDLGAAGQVLEGLSVFFSLSGRYIDGIAEFKYALAHLLDQPEEAAELRARILNRQYGLEPLIPQFEPAEFDNLLAFFRAAGNEAEEALALLSPYKKAIIENKFDRALALSRERLAIYRRLDETYHLALCLNNTAFTSFLVGRVADGLAAAEECLAITRQDGNRVQMAGALRTIGGHRLFFSGDYEEAVHYYREAVDVLVDMGVKGLAASGLARLSLLALITHDPAEAQRLGRRALHLAQEANSPADMGGVYSYLGLMNAIEGRQEIAKKQLTAALTLTSNQSETGPAHLGLSIVYFLQGDMARADHELLMELAALVLASASAFLVWCLGILAVIRAGEGQLVQAAELLALGKSHPACPTGWWANWPAMQTVEARLENELAPAELLAAQERGRETGLIQVFGKMLGWIS
jgi:predicted ATPase